MTEKTTKVKKETPLVETEEVKKVVQKEQPLDYEDYQKFATLKFLMWDSDRRTYEAKKLKPATLDVFKELEKKFKAYKGKKPSRSASVHLGTGIGVGKIVEGIAVPASLYQKFVNKKLNKKYFS